MITNRKGLPQILVVRSSAGAGKTYALALQYLYLLCADTGRPGVSKHNLSNVVAITFTNKAAAEMRSRIIDWMKRIILGLTFEGSQERPVDQIIGLLPGAPEASVVRIIEQNFERLLKDFYDFKVGTIDSFVNLTLKASAFKLGLPPDFDISTESSRHIGFVIQECLQQILEDRQVKEVFDRFLRNYLELEGERAGWAPRDFLVELVSLFWKEEAKENKPFSPAAGVHLLKNRSVAVEKAVRALVAAMESSPGLKTDRRFAQALQAFSIPPGNDFKVSSYFRRDRIANSLNKGSQPPVGALEDMWERIRADLAEYVESLSESKFSAYLEIYHLFKRFFTREVTYRKRLVLVEELNLLLQKIVARESFVPELYYTLAEEYRHFLIDEFQDTNVLQWKNMETLVEEALSRGGTLFLVGDKKQAIYRWRGGNPELVDEILRQYGRYDCAERSLDTNYRSCEHIVEFNNKVFHAASIRRLVASALGEDSHAGEDGVAGTYRDSAQQFTEKAAAQGYVFLERITVQDGEGGTEESPLSKEEAHQAAGERFARLVEELRARRIFPDRDIAVLVRRKEEARRIVRILLEMGIAVDSELTVNVKNNPLVKETIDFLRFLNNPGDDLSFAGFVTGEIFRKRTGVAPGAMLRWITRERLKSTAGHLYGTFRHSYGTLWEANFLYFFARAGYLPLYDVVMLFLKKWEVLANFPEDLPYFLHLCEVILGQETGEGSNLTGFLSFWNGGPSFSGSGQEPEEPFLLKTTEGADAIKVLTIHKAKGLQFPVVILPFATLTTFADSDRRDKSRYFVSGEAASRLLYLKRDYLQLSPSLRAHASQRDRDYLLDELNNLYVACTRAEKELYLLLPESKRRKNLFAEYSFTLEGLKQVGSGNRIEIGWKTQGSASGPAAAKQAEVDSLPTEAPLLHGVEGELPWMDKMRRKLEDLQGISREQILARQKGDVIHYILSLIQTLPEDYREVVNEAVLRGIERYGFHRHLREVGRTVATFFSNPSFRAFFQAGLHDTVFVEKEITSRQGFTFKIDRLVVGKDRIDIVDFKTGEGHREEHARQIEEYGSLVAEIYPGRALAKHLLYIDDGRAVSL